MTTKSTNPWDYLPKHHQPQPTQLRPREVIDLKYDLARWTKSDSGHKYLLGFARSEAEKRAGTEGLNSSQLQLALEAGNTMVESQLQTLMTARSFYVTAEMLDMVEAGSQTMPTDIGLFEDELIARSGFIFFERPIYHLDVNNRIIGTRVATYRISDLNDHYYLSPFVQQSSDKWLEVYAYSSIDDPQDYFAGDSAPDGSPGLAKLDFASSHMTYPPRGMMYLGFGTLLLEHTSEEIREIVDNNKIQIQNFDDDTPENIELRRNIVLSQCQVYITLFNMMNGMIRDMPTVEPDRAQRRRIKFDKPPDPVTIITLRRVYEPDRSQYEEDTSSPRNWSHRWMVSGHWRKIKDKDNNTRAVWVRPYVKGPEDKPLIPKQKLVVFRR